jgi:hypothetical protein
LTLFFLDLLMDLLENKIQDGQEDSNGRTPPNDFDTASENSQPAATAVHVTSGTPLAMDDGIQPHGSTQQFPESAPQPVPHTVLDGYQSDSSASSGCSLEISKDLAEDLIFIFFEKIQPWLSLLHKPRFFARYMTGPADSLSRIIGYSVEDSLLLYGIFSLAARYSDHQSLAHLPPIERGAFFEAKAIHAYDNARGAIEPSTMSYLQGCILLAFYLYTSGPSPRGWILTGVCVRMAYDLGLDTIDANSDDGPLNAAQWSADEELRRSWWLVWELDTFGSTISRRPYAIDRRRMVVKLPVNDDAWFSDTPVRSAVLRTKPALAWKALRNVENQDERAWFLIANYLMALAHDILHAKEDATENEKQEVANAITCFELLLPPHFRLGKVSLGLSNSSRSNFIISIHLMVMSARAGLSATEARGSNDFESSDTAMSPINLTSRYQGLPRIISQWTPEYIGLSHPFIACMMVPVCFGPSLPSDSTATGNGLLEDMAVLVLSQYAYYWKIGNQLLRKYFPYIPAGLILITSRCNRDHQTRDSCQPNRIRTSQAICGIFPEQDE